jgi:act minimal PKS chain-length factor (CLF/KS beta)
VVSAAAYLPELALSARRAGWLAPTRAFAVFDRRSRGTAIGEAGVALVLEPVERAKQRGARPKSFLLAQTSRFARPAEQRASALERAARAVLGSSGRSTSDLALASTGANGVPEVDRAEAQALLGVLGAHAASTPVIAVKAALGETLEACGLLQAAVASHALATGQAPPIAGLDLPLLPGLDYVTKARQLRPGPALVTCTSTSGACSALLLAAHDS